ncbi:hypothetical protein ACLQ8Z_07405 [Bordetella hinzii]|uniref:hypothetical protein n=1 Tax=Bordetella hinzii TaxID=103855 RepID=UPI00045A1318|nr:hypothetical protein [Bordetella hinzii]KCB50810.1 FlxA-like protein [Bordetella hinzii 1277]
MAISSVGSSAYASILSRSAPAASSGKSESAVQQTLRELQKQLRLVLQQMERVRNSNATAEQKAQQLQALNSQAAALQGQIQKILQEQLKQLQG